MKCLKLEYIEKFTFYIPVLSNTYFATYSKREGRREEEEERQGQGGGRAATNQEEEEQKVTNCRVCYSVSCNVMHP